MWRLVALLAVLAGPAAAADFTRCTKVQIAAATDALGAAADLALAAAAAVSDGADYGRWFGRWDARRAGDVRATYTAIAGVLASEDLEVVCPQVGLDGCTTQIFANVFPDQAFVVNLCPSFFGMPSIRGIVPGSYPFETGTREGTIIHEVSHFTAVAGTVDACYGRTDCAMMARRDAGTAVRNADSLQYFAEDVALRGR